MWYVYLLRSTKKRWYYVGSSDNLDRRLREHNAGAVISTKHYKPFTLVLSKEFNTESEARGYERKVKEKRREKEALIRSVEN